MTDTKRNNRLTLGLLADWFDERYQQVILETVAEATAQRGLNLVAFAGGIPGSEVRESQFRHRALELAAPQNIQGVILVAGTMVNQLGEEALSGILAQLGDVPRCSIGVALPGIPSVLVDNQSGIGQAVAHLLQRHECKQIAFIRGPRRNKEAESRFAAYLEALDQAGISFDDSLAFQGSFLRASGEEAVEHWERSGVTPDAVLAANDEMAIGAQRAFLASGKRVPEDVRVVGFDDLGVAVSANPPLTTVRQPLRELAVAAVRSVIDQIQGRAVAERQMLQTHLVMRESCGGTIRLTSTGQSQVPEETGPATEGFGEEFRRRLPALKAELARTARGDFLKFPGWEDQLIASCEEQALHGSTAFIDSLSRFLSGLTHQGIALTRCDEVTTAFRRFVLPACGDDVALRARMENIFQEARLLTAGVVARAHTQELASNEVRSRRLARVAASLAGCFDLEQLSMMVRQELPGVGMASCILAVYEPFGLATERASTVPERARLIAAYGVGNTEVQTGTVFECKDLAPSRALGAQGAHQHTVLPLFLKGQDLGFCLLDCQKRGGFALEVLRQQLSIGLYGALMAEEVAKR